MHVSIPRLAVASCFVLFVFFALVGSVPAAEPASKQGADILADIEVLDLDTAARIALAENPSLQAARARVEQVTYLIQQAQSAYWPQVDVTGGYSRVELSQTTIDNQLLTYNALRQANPTLPPVSIPNPEDYYQVGLRASWLIFNGLAREFTVAAAKYGAKATASAKEDAQRLLLSGVTSAYLQAQLAIENVAIARADEAFNQRLLTEAKLRYDVGTGPLSDVLNFQVRANAALSRRLEAEQTYRTNRISLAVLMGLPPGRMPEHVRLAQLTPPTPQELASPRTDELVEIALNRRPDLQQREYSVQQAEANVTVAKSGYYPTVALNGDYTGERAEDLSFEGDDFGNSIGVGLTWNIFSGGLTRARIGEAKAQLMIAARNQDDTHLQVTSDVHRVVTQIRNAQEQLALQETNTELYQRQRDLVEKEYKAGVGSLVRLNEAQRDLSVSQSQLALSRVTLRLYWYNLLTATGQISETFAAR